MNTDARVQRVNMYRVNDRTAQDSENTRVLDKLNKPMKFSRQLDFLILQVKR